MFSKELADKILEMSNKLNSSSVHQADLGSYVVCALHEMGPCCFFQDLPNEEQAKGAIAVLDWIIKGVPD